MGRKIIEKRTFGYADSSEIGYNKGKMGLPVELVSGLEKVT